MLSGGLTVNDRPRSRRIASRSRGRVRSRCDLLVDAVEAVEEPGRVGGDARPGVADLDGCDRVLKARGEHDLAVGGVAGGVGSDASADADVVMVPQCPQTRPIIA